MKVNGYLIREAIKKYELRRDTSASMFSDSLHKFASDQKASPNEVVAKYRAAEDAVASLQVAQARYNLLVQVTVLENRMTLMEAIKRIGGAGRLEKMWRDAVSPKTDRYSYRDDSLERDNTKERATATMTQDEREEKANKAASRAGAFRAAIASGNGVEVDSDQIGLDSNLLTE